MLNFRIFIVCLKKLKNLYSSRCRCGCHNTFSFHCYTYCKSGESLSPLNWISYLFIPVPFSIALPSFWRVSDPVIIHGFFSLVLIDSCLICNCRISLCLIFFKRQISLQITKNSFWGFFYLFFLYCSFNLSIIIAVCYRYNHENKCVWSTNQVLRYSHSMSCKIYLYSSFSVEETCPCLVCLIIHHKNVKHFDSASVLVIEAKGISNIQSRGLNDNAIDD